MRLSRGVAAGAALVLAVGLGPVSSPAPAGANGAATAATVAEQQAWLGSANYDLDDCTGSGPVAMTGHQDHFVHTPIDGLPRELRLDQTGSADNATVRSTGSAQARASRPRPGTYTTSLTAELGVSATPSLDVRRCRILLQTAASDVVTVPVARPSWFVARSSRTGVVHGYVSAYRTAGSELYHDVPMGEARSALLPPGTYDLSITAIASAEVPKASGPVAAGGRVAGSILLVPAGALRTRSGTALRYVRPGDRSCARHRLPVALTRAARTKVRTITFSVNGHRRLVLRGPALRARSVRVGPIADRSSGQVRAVVVTKRGARHTLTTTSWPCA
ncbi:hypothetical protein SAMN05421671_2096 [Pimelobacter simplex]|nr:hypothetical protein SAMN05421671_2096 [Pimelobacter simplex]